MILLKRKSNQIKQITCIKLTRTDPRQFDSISIFQFFLSSLIFPIYYINNVSISSLPRIVACGLVCLCVCFTPILRQTHLFYELSIQLVYSLSKIQEHYILRSLSITQINLQLSKELFSQHSLCSIILLQCFLVCCLADLFERLKSHIFPDKNMVILFI